MSSESMPATLTPAPSIHRMPKTVKTSPENWRERPMMEASRVKQVRVKPTPIETLDRELEQVAQQGKVTILAQSTKTTPTESYVFLKSNKSPPKTYKESSDSDSNRRSRTRIYPASDTSSVRHSRKMQLDSVPESSADEAERTVEETLLPRKGKAK